MLSPRLHYPRRVRARHHQRGRLLVGAGLFSL